MITNFIAGIVILLAVAAAARYVYRAKKNGARCVGCAASGCCCEKGQCSGCGH